MRRRQPAVVQGRRFIAHPPHRAGDGAGQQRGVDHPVGVGHGNRRQQAAGIGVLRRLEDLLARADLDDLAHVHHRHAVADLFHHRHVMRDEEVGQPLVLLQAQQQIKDLRLDRHIQRRNRLIRDDHLGVAGQRAGDAHALPLAARHLVGKPAQVGLRQAHPVQQIAGAGTDRGAGWQKRMHHHRFGNAVLDPLAGIEGGKGVLKHVLHLLQHGAFFPPAHRRHVAAAKPDGACGRFQDLLQHPPGGGFAAARFPHQRQRLARREIKRQALHRMGAVRHAPEGAPPCREARGQPFGLQQRHRLGGPPGVWRGLAAHRPKARHGGQQLLRVGVGGGGEQLPHRCLFQLFTVAHHDNLVRHFRDHGHIMRDEDHRHAQFGLQLADGVEDLRLNGHVQRGRRLIRDQKLRPARQRHRDHHALQHPARQLVWMLPHHVRRMGNANFFKHLQRNRLGLLPFHGPVHQDGFHDLVADAEHRVERGHRFLKDHRDLGAPDAPHPFGAGGHKVQWPVPAVKQDRACVDAPARKIGQPHDGARCDRFARPGFAHDGQRLARMHVEAD